MSERPRQAAPRPAVPGPAQERVAASLAAARLERADREDVQEELSAHFEDGLESGKDLSALLRDFGEPAAAGALIGRSVRRRRRFRRPALRVARLFALSATLVYATIFARLHARPPEAATGASFDARERVLRPWSPESPPIAGAVSRAQGFLEAARGACPAGDCPNGHAALSAALEAAREIGAGPFPAHDLAAMRLAAQIGPAADEAVRSGEIAWRPEKVRAAFDELLASMYTRGDDGRLTASGLRIFQAWKGKKEPGLWAVLLEPAYFSNPASRGQVRRELERFLDLAARSEDRAFEGERESLRASPGPALQLVALEIPLAHLSAVREARRKLDARLSLQRGSR